MAAELRVARESDSPRIEALLGEYLRELDAYEPRPQGDDDDPAQLNYPYLSLYWSEAGRHPLFILSGGETVGFAFVRELPGGDSVVHSVAEFYVQPAKRRQGIGRSAAFALWKRFPGPWQLEANPVNTTAHRFWRSCIEAIATEAPRVSETLVRGSRWIQFEWCVD